MFLFWKDLLSRKLITDPEEIQQPLADSNQVFDKNLLIYPEDIKAVTSKQGSSTGFDELTVVRR